MYASSPVMNTYTVPAMPMQYPPQSNSSGYLGQQAGYQASTANIGSFPGTYPIPRMAMPGSTMTINPLSPNASGYDMFIPPSSIPPAPPVQENMPPAVYGMPGVAMDPIQGMNSLPAGPSQEALMNQAAPGTPPAPESTQAGLEKQLAQLINEQPDAPNHSDETKKPEGPWDKARRWLVGLLALMGVIFTPMFFWRGKAQDGFSGIQNSELLCNVKIKDPVSNEASEVPGYVIIKNPEKLQAFKASQDPNKVENFARNGDIEGAIALDSGVVYPAKDLKGMHTPLVQEVAPEKAPVQEAPASKKVKIKK